MTTHTEPKDGWKEVSHGMWERNVPIRKIKVTPEIYGLYVRSMRRHRASNAKERECMRRFISFLRSAK